MAGLLAITDAALNEAAWADLASASTTDIGAEATNNVRITGTTTITSLGTVASGCRRICRFAGALTLTHNATSLILPGGANITTAANDTATFVSLGSGNWICVSYNKANGGSVVSGAGLVFRQVTDSSDVALSLVPTHTNVGSTFSVTIPAKGLIKISPTARVDASGGAVALIDWGIRISSTNYWGILDINGSSTQYMGSDTGPVASGTYRAFKGLSATDATASRPWLPVVLDIEAIGIPTGAQTVQTIAAYEGGSGSATLKGTQQTTRVYYEIQDFS